MLAVHAGRTFEELPFWFPDGIVFGLVNHDSRKVKMNPPPSTVVEEGDEILIVRPTSLPDGPYGPARAPAERDLGTPDCSAINQCPMCQPRSVSRCVQLLRAQLELAPSRAGLYLEMAGL